MLMTFKLGGKKYQLSRDELEETVTSVCPKPLDKYAVLVQGKLFPPKQALSLVLKRPPATFTTQDANRILAALGFEIVTVKQTDLPSRTDSERLFQAYLDSCGLQYSLEPNIPGTTMRPDYHVLFRDAEILFEVKEFRPTPENFLPGGGAYDPYQPIREKIIAARKKFQDLETFCCCLVLFNERKPLVHLEWQFVYGAMLGNLAFQMPFNPSREEFRSDQARLGFYGGGGKMLHYIAGKPVEPQNKTVSAILVLDQLPVGSRRFQAEVQRAEGQLKRKLTLEEFWDKMQFAKGTERDVSLRQLRVVVHENPYARIAFPSELFRGPYDERFGPRDGKIQRLYAGEQIQELEASESLK